MVHLDRFEPCEIKVYRWCMSRTNIDIDERACAEVMRRYRFTTKKEAVNFALKTLAAEPLNLDEAKSLRGSGWDGDLDELRSTRSA
jgi:Arc/MetJ family transcription regulator